MTGTVIDFSPTGSVLLGPDDPPPFEVVNPDGLTPAVLFCDHASRAVPAKLAGLGLDESILQRHIGWDIGAGDVTRRLATLIDTPAVLAGYSRLTIDCNRPLGTPESIPRVSDGVEIPGNHNIDNDAAEARVEACFRPYHRAVDQTITRVAERWNGVSAIISMHSFTPVFDGTERPWHVGILWDHDAQFAKRLIAALDADPSICVGDNEPYSGRVPVPYSIPTHAVGRGLPHVTIEIRQDLIDTHHGAETWANLLAAALGELLADVSLFRKING